MNTTPNEPQLQDELRSDDLDRARLAVQRANLPTLAELQARLGNVPELHGKVSKSTKK